MCICCGVTSITNIALGKKAQYGKAVSCSVNNCVTKLRVRVKVLLHTFLTLTRVAVNGGLYALAI
jgi:hypothetical protein